MTPWAVTGAPSFGVGRPSSRRCQPALGPLGAPRSLGAARSQDAAVGSKPSACQALELVPAVVMALVLAEARRAYLLARPAGCLALQGTALAMVARDLSRAPSAQKEMAMEWPLQEKLLFKPTNMLQQKKSKRCGKFKKRSL